MILIIAEKAIAGRRIAAILAGKPLPGERTENAIHFDFEKDGKAYTVIPLSGHIVDVDFPVSYKQWLGTDVRKLAVAPINYNETEQSISGLLKKVAPNIDEVIIATDSDREGEAIGLESLDIVKKANPNVKVLRASFSAITEKDIKDAFKNLGKLDLNLAESANSRREIDLIWGAVLTRFLSLISGRLGKEFLSTGRVQGPSVDYSEDILVKGENGLINIFKIGDFVKRFEGSPFEEIGNCKIFNAKGAGFSALSFNQKTLKTEFKPITAVVKHKYFGNLFQITLETGRKVKITGSHSIFVLRQGVVQVFLGEDLKPGDIVLSPKIIEENNVTCSVDLLEALLNLDDKTKSKVFISNAFQKKWVKLNQGGCNFLRSRRLEKGLIVYKTRFASSTISQWEHGKKKKVSHPQLADYLTALDYNINWFLQEGFAELVKPVRTVVKLSDIKSLDSVILGQESRLYSFDLKYSLPLTLNFSPELIRLLGYFIAEGSFSKSFGALDFGINEQHLAEDAVKCIEKVFGRKPKIHPKKSTLHLNFGGKFVKILFEQIFKTGSGARNKRIPPIVFNLSKDLKKEFLKGYFEGDGHFSESGQLEAATASKQLASDLLYLLSQFGIVGSVEKKVNRSPLPNQQSSKPRIIFRVKVSGKRNLFELFYIVPQRQKERAKTYLSKPVTRCGHDGIPIYETGLSKIWLDMPRHYSQRIGCVNLSNLLKTTSKKLSTATLQKLTTLAETDLAFLKIIKIEKVSPSTDFVYDLSVEGNENFAGGFGGIFLHNTLALIVDREKERLAFKTKKYWEIHALFEKGKKQFNALHKKGKFWNGNEAEKAVNCGKPLKGIVREVKKRKKTLAKPLPFNTTSFLRAATAIGFSAGRAMQIAESLYQSGYLSYPRTDNSVYPSTLDLKATLKELSKVKEFAPLVDKLLKKPKLVPSAGKLAKDHPPIHPVTAVSKEKLDQQQWRIYELVCRRFMATLADDALTENISVEIDLNKEPFVATGQTYLEMGWKFFYPYSKATEVVLPALEKGDKVNLLKLDLLGKETLPPPRYSQGALIKAMSDLNLGTKSTRAETIQKLYRRNYIEGQKALAPTRIALAVIDSLQKHDSAVVKPKMTADLEHDMDLVANGTKKKETVVGDSRKFLTEVLKPLLENKNEIGSAIRNAARADSVIGPCSGKDCEGSLLIRKGRTGKRFLGCTAYPKCTVTYPLPQKGRITVLPGMCKDCNNPMIFVVGKRYRYKMCIDHKCISKADWGKKKAAKEETEKKKADETKDNSNSDCIG